MRIFQKNATIIIASHNQGKCAEIAQLLAPYNLDVRSARDFNLPEPDETGNNFRENAILKARFVAARANQIALSDDSGLAVEALGGQPGIFSARWAETPKGRDFNAACHKVWQAIQNANADNYRAAFICALALANPDGTAQSFEGRVSGTITYPPKGKNGFGYDPIFTPKGYQQTFGEMKPELKHQISHRAQAFAQLCRALGTS